MSDFTDHLKPAEPTGPDTLARERAQSNVPVDQLASHLLARDGFLERQERVLREVQREKLFSKATQQNMSRPDRYRLGLARAKLLRRMADRLGWSSEDHHMSEYLVDDVSPYMLHMGMFATTIREQASDEQQAYWMPLIEKWQIIGSYAQTELGHGSNVRGLELQARWENQTKEFILHSPTLTSSKWWNGSLGRTATHAIVVAQLMLPERRDHASPAIPPNNDSSEGPQPSTAYISHGPHPFVIRIRDAMTHKPLPGIVVGDIGPKYGYASMDNAYCLFDHVRIPHSAFLSRYSQVDIDTGTYKRSKGVDPAVVYGSLTAIRVHIVMHARLVLARAVTVAVRYLAIRRQFRDRDDDSNSGPEMAVLDYPTVQVRVLPLLATTFALHYAGLAMGEQYAATRKGISGGDFGTLADMHATSSGLKSLCTGLAADGIETCRRACGGHGFGGGSGLIQLNNDYLSKPTVEGDNWMITQQTAAYLIKQVDAIIKKHAQGTSAPPHTTPTNPLNPTEAYLTTHLLEQQQQHSSPLPPFPILPLSPSTSSNLVHAFNRHAASLALAAHTARTVHQTPWTTLLIPLHALSTAHSQALLVRTFHSALTDPPLAHHPIPPLAHQVLTTAFHLFALSTLSAHAPSFLTTSCISLATLALLPAAIQQLMAQLRPHAVALVDAWMVPDYLLDSALGRSDGRVYEDLFERAHRRNPLNGRVVNPYVDSDEVEVGGVGMEGWVERVVAGGGMGEGRVWGGKGAKL